MTDNPMDTEREQVEPPSEFFVAVRARGMLNAMLDGPSNMYEKLHPEMRVRWEYSPKDGDYTLVVAREGQGFHVVDHSELFNEEFAPTEHQKTEGQVRVGDLVLMAADRDIVNLLDLEDAKLAYDDWKLPETTYREYVDSLRVKTKSGTVVSGRAIGEVRRVEETVQVSAAPE